MAVVVGGTALLAGLVVVRLAAAPMSLDLLLERALPPLVEMQTGDPVRVSVRHATVQWMVFRRNGAPFEVRAKDLSAQRLAAPTDRVEIGHLDVELAALPLLLTRVRPIRIEAAQVHGVLGVDAAGYPKPLGAGRRRPAAPRPAGAPGWLQGQRSAPEALRPLLSHLRALRVTDARVELTGGQSWRLEAPLTEAAVGPDGWRGRMRAVLSDGGGRSLSVSADSPAPLLWHLHVDPLTPSVWVRPLPFGVVMPDAVRAAALPVGADAQLRFGAAAASGWLPETATLSVAAGSGRLGGLDVAGASAEAVLRRAGGRETVDLTRAELRPQGMVPLLAHGTLSMDRQGRTPRIDAWAGFQPGSEAALSLAQLAVLWPPGVAKGGRDWVTGNMPVGEIRHVALTVSLAGEDFGSLSIGRIDGGLDVTGAEVHWLRPMPPLTAVAGHVGIHDPDRLDIAVSQGRQDDGAGHTILLRSAGMTISGLTKPDQYGVVSIDLAGDLGAILHLLSHPRLHLLSNTSLDLGGAAGASELKFHLGLPLDDDVRVEQLDVVADAHITGARLAHAIAGQALDDAVLDLHATQDGMTLSGRGLVAQLPSALDLAMDFRDGPPSQTVMQASLDVEADRAHVLDAVRAQGLGWLVAGQDDSAAKVSVAYVAHRSGEASVSARADLTSLSLRLPVGWSKPSGAMAEASGRLLLDHDHIAGVDDLRIDAPGFVVRASGSRLTDEPGVSIVTSRLELGRTRMSGEAMLPSGPARPAVARIDAPVVDLVPVLDQSGATRRALDAVPSSPPRKGTQTGKPWSVEARIGRLLVGERSGLGEVRLSMAGRGTDVDRGHLTVQRPSAVDMRLAPAGRGLRATGRVDDLGALLTGLDLGQTIHNGLLRLDATLPDRHFAGGAEGGVTVENALVAGVPQLARAAAALSLGGLLGQAKTGDALVMDRAVVPFRFLHGQVQVHDALAHNPAIGVTLRGGLDLRRSTADLRGTVVPAWALNHLPGRLPVVGKLFSPETGGGVIAMTMRITGPLDDPSVAVNPLSLLAPGALRTLFK